MPNESQAQYGPPSALIIGILETCRVLRWLIGGATIVGLAYFGVAVPVTVAAGQETNLTVVYQALVDLRVHIILSYGAAVVFFTLWRMERKTRIIAVARENRRNKELEKRIDPGRTSSGFQEESRQTPSLGRGA